MKNGTVMQKLAQDPRVSSIKFLGTEAQVALKAEFKNGNDQVRKVKTAGEAIAFVRGAEKAPEGYTFVRNIMSGNLFAEREGTPYTASPRSETYWTS